MTKHLTIALDAMGGDHAPASVVEGARLARTRYPSLRFIFVGDQEKLQPLIDSHTILKNCHEIVHTIEKVDSSAKPSQALRQAKQSSMRLAIEAVKNGHAQAVVSAGNTGALMAISKFLLKTLPGISRPAIVTILPTMTGECVMLDLGANIECDAKDLFQFAIMGDAFARAVLGLTAPRIGLLNVGSEEQKGHDEVKEAWQMLKDTKLPLHFHGFVEGNDITEGTVDVIVTDGFTGNVALKTAEGTAKLIGSYLKKAFTSSVFSKAGYLIAKPSLDAVREKLDPRKHNGAMFVGLNGIAVKSHGGADGFSFSNAIAVAAELANYQVNDRILDEIKLSGLGLTPTAMVAGGEK